MRYQASRTQTPSVRRLAVAVEPCEFCFSNFVIFVPSWFNRFGSSPSFSFCPGTHLLVLSHFHVDHVGPAAYGAVLDVLLVPARGQVDRNDDLLAAGIADVALALVQPSQCPAMA